MGWRFRKSIKIFPGFRLNLGKRGVNSVSVGKAGFTTNISSRGVRHTVGVPGTGLSYTTKAGSSNNETSSTQPQRVPQVEYYEPQPWYCGYCGQLNKFARPNCGYCAAPAFPAQHSATVPRNASVGTNGVIILGAVGAGVIVAAIGFCVLVEIAMGPRRTTQPVITKATPTPMPTPVPTIEPVARSLKATPRPKPTVTYNQRPVYPAPVPAPPSRNYDNGYIRGPRGGCYYYTSSGRKQYVDRSLCN